MNAITTIEGAPLATLDDWVAKGKDTAYRKVALETGRGLNGLLRYDPKSGALYWRLRPVEMFPSEHSARTWNTRYAGKIAFTSKNSAGYYHGTIFGHSLVAHRVVWAVVHGRWPNNEIDHINGDKTDNRIENLRDVPAKENLKNLSRASNNTSGVTGVHWDNYWQRWVAKIMVGRRTKALGTFVRFEDAVTARRAAERELGFADGHGKEPVSS